MSGADATSPTGEGREPSDAWGLPLLASYWGRSGLPWVAALVAVLVCPLSLLVFPPQRPVERADVVFVIGPPDGWRIDWAKQVVDDGLARAMMISVPDVKGWELCEAGSYGGVPVFCERPDPFTTQGEARWLRDMMAQHGWGSATVITVTPHVSRTRLYFERCIPAGVNVVGRSTGLDSAGDWLRQYRYQLGAMLKAVFITVTC